MGVEAFQIKSIDTVVQAPLTKGIVSIDPFDYGYRIFAFFSLTENHGHDPRELIITDVCLSKEIKCDVARMILIKLENGHVPESIEYFKVSLGKHSIDEEARIEYESEALVHMKNRMYCICHYF
jgi:hypothetical protein